MSKTSGPQKVLCFMQWLNSKDFPKIKKKIIQDIKKINYISNNLNL